MFQDLPHQFDLGPHYCAPHFTEYDRIVFETQMSEMSSKCQWRTPTGSLKPNFMNQLNRLVVPCQGTEYYCWVRSGRVISLGELFQEMHLQHNAREIFDLYLHLDIVSVKRCKPGPKNKHSTQRWFACCRPRLCQALWFEAALGIVLVTRWEYFVLIASWLQCRETLSVVTQMLAMFHDCLLSGPGSVGPCELQQVVETIGRGSLPHRKLLPVGEQ